MSRKLDPYIYTDGSAIKGTVNAGFRSRIENPNHSNGEIPMCVLCLVHIFSDERRGQVLLQPIYDQLGASKATALPLFKGGLASKSDDFRSI